MQHQPIDKDDWLRIVRRSDLSFTTKGIAMYLAIFADQDGTSVRPGEERAAGELVLTARCVRQHLEILREAGLIERMNRGTAVRGRADLYRLTSPGAGHDPVPMRFDPDGNRLTPERPVRKRAKKDEGAPADDITGTGVPVSQDPSGDGTAAEDPLTGTGVPVDNPDSGPEAPVDDAAYRNPDAGKPERLAATYRNPGSDLPEPGSRLTGTGVPATNQTNHDHPTNPAGLPYATTSLALPVASKTIKKEVESDPEHATARTVLADLPPPERDHWRRKARTELEHARVPLDHRAVDIRAADLATRPAAPTPDPVTADLDAWYAQHGRLGATPNGGP